MRVTCTADQVVTEISYLGVTLTFGEPVTFGHFETDGSPWFIGPVAFPTISHTWEGSGARHGAMINPASITAQGFDSRVDGYDASLDAMVTPPDTIEPGETLCKAISLDPETTPLGTGGSATAIDVMAIFTCLAEPPAAGSYRPPYAGTDKTMRNRSEVNHALSPGLGKPTGPVTPLPTLDMSSIVRAPLYDVGGRSRFRTKLRPQSNFGGDVYPSYAFPFVSNAAAYSLLAVDDADEVRHRLVQHGLDYWAIAQFGDDCFSNGAGFGSNGALFLILYAALFLEDEEMLAAGEMTTLGGWPKFGPQYQFYSSADAWDGYVLPKPRDSYPDGPPLFGDYPDGSGGLGENWSERNLSTQAAAIADELQDGYHDANSFPTTSDYYPAPELFQGVTEYTSQPAGTYMYLAAQGHLGLLFVARKLGTDQYFNAPATFDWLERAVNDCFNLCTQQGLRNANIYVFGGNNTTNLRNFMQNMYLNYHGDRATLSGQSAAATGATTARLTVTTDKGSGKLHAVATTSATKPNGHQVRLGLTKSDAAAVAKKSSDDFLTTSGEKTLDLTGLTPGVQQWIHVTHYGEDASIAAVVTAGPITPS